jgi:hypothetical protein
MKNTFFTGRKAFLAVLVLTLAIMIVGCDIGSYDVRSGSQTPPASNDNQQEPSKPTPIPEATKLIEEISEDDKPPATLPEEPNLPVIDSDTIFLPIILDVEPYIVNEDTFLMALEDYPEFHDLFQLFLSETGLQERWSVTDGMYEPGRFIPFPRDRLRVLYYNFDDWALITYDELNPQAYDHYHNGRFTLDVLSFSFTGHEDDVLSSEGRLKRISAGSSDVEIVTGIGAIVCVAIFNDSSFPFAFVDITGSYIFWNIAATPRR